MPSPQFMPADTRSQAMRGLIACVGSFFAFFGFWIVHVYAKVEPSAGNFYDAVMLDLVQAGLLVAMASVILLGVFCWQHRQDREERPWLTWVLSTWLSLAYTLLGIMYGFYTTPWGFVIMGVLAFGLLFFDRRAVLAGFALSMSIFAGNELLLYLDFVEYAPLLSRSLFEGDGTELAWWWQIHLRVIFYVAFLAFFALLMFQLDQLEAQRRELERLAVTDPLTGVSNRRRFTERLEEEMIRRDHGGRPFCVLLCDADHFKKVNDTWGHHAGDAVIRHIAALLAGSVRGNVDTVGRLGGEEFGVILPETTPDAAREVAERVIAQMRSHTFLVDGHAFRVTLSVGLAEAREGSGEDALREADANLYKAKSGGRDRVAP